jgi:NitT/TauT family transport system ATP-binding protein
MVKPKEPPAMSDALSSRRRVVPQAIRLRHLTKTFPGRFAPLPVLHDISMDVAQGEFAAIVGPSGCGKSTIIRIVAGLTPPTSGTVLVNDKSSVEPGRDCGMVFQAYTSFPWLSVLDNIAFGLRYAKPRDNSVVHRERARELARLVGLEEFGDAFIGKLSGGMKQRVAIASVLAVDPSILLMDEPFGALDSQTRMVMQELLLEVVEKSKKTVVFVTHDIEEALLLADRIYVCGARPASILSELEVPFDRPRSANTRNQREFFEMKHEIFHLLRDHVHEQMLEAAYARRRQSRT